MDNIVAGGDIHRKRCILLLRRRPHSHPIFPYTTLFRSPRADEIAASVVRALPGVEITYAPDPVRQGILDSWPRALEDRKSTRLNSSHQIMSYAVICLKKKKRESV